MVVSAHLDGKGDLIHLNLPRCCVVVRPAQMNWKFH